jgi:GntR family transcriptional regulator
MAQTGGRTDGSKAHRVYLLLRDEILRGVYPSGGLLPGELKLADAQGVSRVTIRRAMDQLAADGLIDRRPGAGTRVTGGASPGAIAADFASLMPQVVQMGQTTTARLLSCAYVAPPAAIAAALGSDDRMQRAVRVRLVDGRVFSHLTTHVPENLAQSFSETDLATTPLFRLLERSGVQVGHAQQSISATLAPPDVAEALDLTPGAALIALTRVVFDAHGRGVEHLTALYRPDRFRLDMTLNRVGEGDRRQWEPAVVPLREAAE